MRPPTSFRAWMMCCMRLNRCAPPGQRRWPPKRHTAAALQRMHGRACCPRSSRQAALLRTLAQNRFTRGFVGWLCLSPRQALAWPTRYADLASQLGVRWPKGILLHGPPGCGKTSAVHAVARQCDAVVHLVTAASIVGAFTGVFGSPGRCRLVPSAWRSKQAAPALSAKVRACTRAWLPMAGPLPCNAWCERAQGSRNGGCGTRLPPPSRTPPTEAPWSSS